MGAGRRRRWRRQDHPNRGRRPAVARGDLLCRDAGRALVRRGVRRQGLGRRSGPWNRVRSAGGSPFLPMLRGSSPRTPRAIHGSSLGSPGRTPRGSQRSRPRPASWAGRSSFRTQCFGGIASIGDSVWALMGPDSAGGSRIIELGATGPTGREEPLQHGLDPDGAVVAFGSVWIPLGNQGSHVSIPGERARPIAGRPARLTSSTDQLDWQVVLSKIREHPLVVHVEADRSRTRHAEGRPWIGLRRTGSPEARRLPDRAAAGQCGAWS